MRILDFADGFESAVQPSIVGVAASDIEVTPVGGISSTDVQSALAELDSEKIPKVSSTDNAVTRFDGTTGLVQNSGVTVDDSNNVAGVQNLTTQGTAQNIGTGSSNTTVNIGTGSGNNTITIGGPNSTIIMQGTQEYQNVVNYDVQDKNITVNKGGSASSGTSAGISVEEGGSITGRVTTSSDRNGWEVKAPNTAGVASIIPGSSNDEVALLVKTQTLSGKSFSDEMRLAEISTPSTPSAGFRKIYPKSNGKLYTLNSSGLEKEVGSGAGGGSKNYLGNINGVDNGGDFENNTVGNWVLGHVSSLTNKFPTAGSTPTFGTGASANLSIATTNVASLLLSGSYSLKYESSTATTAGDFLASPAFTVDQSDLAKILTFKFSYIHGLNPQSADYSGTSNNSFGVAIYDVTAGTWIQPTGVWAMTQKLGAGIATGTFQSSATSTQYRLVIFNANVTASNINVAFDDFSLGPQTAPIGSVDTDRQAFTPTGAWSSNVSYTGFWRRVGAEMELDITVTCSGAPTGTLSSINMPSGYVIDTSKMSSAIPNATNLNGTGTATDSGIGSYPVTVCYVSTTSFVPLIGNASGTSTTQASITPTVPFTFGAADSVQMIFRVPIVGWSSNVQMSNDTDTRIVDFVGTQSSQAVTANVTNLALTTVKDSHGAWNGTQYVVAVAGDYIIGGSAVASGTASSVAYKNGSPVQNITTIASGVAGGGSLLIPNCVPGDLLSVRFGTSVTITAGYFYINRLSGPSVIAASESVNAFYSIATGPSVASATYTLIKFSTFGKDTHNAYDTSTGIYKIQSPGAYEVSGSFYYGATTATTSDVQFVVYQNGAIVRGVNNPKSGTASTAMAVSAGDIPLQCNAGDQIQIYAYQGSGGSLSLITSGVYNWFSIKRVGN